MINKFYKDELLKQLEKVENMEQMKSLIRDLILGIYTTDNIEEELSSRLSMNLRMRGVKI